MVAKKQPQSFVQAFPAVTPTYIATPAPTIVNGQAMPAVGYTNAPSVYGRSNVRVGNDLSNGSVVHSNGGIIPMFKPNGVSEPPPRITLQRRSPIEQDPDGLKLESRANSEVPQSAPSLPRNGILVNRPVDQKPDDFQLESRANSGVLPQPAPSLPLNSILVNRPPVEPKTEGSLMGTPLDAEFYPDIDV